MARTTRNRMLLVGTMMALALLIAWPAILRAFNPQPEAPGRFGMVGLARGQTARLSAVNIADPTDPTTPPDPCRLTLGFVDTSGRPFVDQERREIAKEVYLLPGQAALLDLRFEAVADGNDWRSTAVDRTGRVQFRAGLELPPNQPPDPCRHLIPTLEVFDNLTGRTMVLYPPTPALPDGNVSTTSTR